MYKAKNFQKQLKLFTLHKLSYKCECFPSLQVFKQKGQPPLVRNITQRSSQGTRAWIIKT